MVKFAFFTKGLVHTFSQKFDVFSPCFFSFKLLKRRFRDVLDTKNLFYTTNKLIIEVEKFAFFAKGLVHDFGQTFEVSLPSLFSAILIKKSFWQCS